MSERMSFEKLLTRTLGRVSNDVDKTEGSFIYDAIAPCVVELYEAYLYIDELEKRVFADTADGDYLDRRTTERGIYRKSATYADDSLVYLTREALDEHSVDINTHEDIRQAIENIDVSWEGIKGKLEKFPPNAHKHSKVEIADFPTDLITSSLFNSYGLGETCAIVSEGSNFDSITKQGRFMVNKPNNKPSIHKFLGEWWYFENIVHNAQYMVQTVTNINPNVGSAYKNAIVSWKRIRNGSNGWGDWSAVDIPTLIIQSGLKTNFDDLTLQGR